MCWSEYEDKDERASRRRKVLPLLAWAVVIGLTLGLVFYVGKVRAEPLYKAAADGAVITLHSDKCALDAVVNLPFKATWEEKGKVFQGCWAGRTDAGLVVFYFDDKTVGLIPIEALSKVLGV